MLNITVPNNNYSNNIVVMATTSHPTTEYSVERSFHKGSVSFTLVCFLIGVLIFVGNTMVCFAYYKVKMLRTLTNKLVISTSISGLLIGALFVPFFVALDDLLQAISRGVIPISSFLSSFLGFSLLFNIAALTYERYIAVFRSLEYNLVITNRRVNKALFVVWTIPFFLSTIPFIFPHLINDASTLYMYFKVYQGFLSCILTFIIFIFFVVYIRVWKTSLFHIALDRKQRISLSSTKLSNQIKEFHRLPLLKRSGWTLCCCVNEEDITEDYDAVDDPSEQINAKQNNENDNVENNRRHSNCSIVLNGVLVEHAFEQPSSKISNIKRVSVTTNTVNSPRKLSVDWAPRSSVVKSSNANRKYSVPVKMLGTFRQTSNKRRYSSDDRIAYREDLVDNVSAKNLNSKEEKRLSFQNTIDEPSSALSSPNRSPESFHSSRSRVSFANCDFTSGRSAGQKTNSFRQRQIKGIIKYSPKRCNTICYGRPQRPVFKKSKSMPSNALIERISIKQSRKAWPKPLTPPINIDRIDRELSRKKSLSFCIEPTIDNEFELEDSPQESPLLRKNSFSPTSILKNSHQVSVETKTDSMLADSFAHSDCSSSLSGKESPACALSPTKIQAIESVDERQCKRAVPASVRRAIFRMRGLDYFSQSQNCSYEMDDQSKTSPFVSDTEDSVSYLRRISIASSVASRLVKSRNSVISQAKEFLHEIRHTKVIAVIVLINALCWLPLIFINIADAVGQRSMVTPTLIMISDFSFLLNSLLMPYIYAFCKHDFKIVFRRKFNWMCKKRNRRSRSHSLRLSGFDK
jgi:Predicted membrane-associated HD superfamily hydrolase